MYFMKSNAILRMREMRLIQYLNAKFPSKLHWDFLRRRIYCNIGENRIEQCCAAHIVYSCQ